MPSAVSSTRGDTPADSSDEDVPPKRVRLERRNGHANGARAHSTDDGDDDDDDDDDDDAASDNILPPAEPDVDEEEELLGQEDVEITKNTSDFQPGAIKWIYCKDFVTYEEIQMHPEPSLNMVIGPNGTGKSTLVCAMCLGLGWSPKVLGRAQDVGEFVKHGASEAVIKIKIQGKKGENDPIIMRKIKKESNKSDWSINGKSSTEKNVKKLAKEYNIQIDNLCQFLPQDKVAEFAKMNPIEKFKSTLRAAAPPDVTADHERLIDSGRVLAELHETQNSDQAQLTAMEEKQRVTQADVDKLKERNAIQDEINLLRKSRPWLEYTALKQEAEDLKAQDQVARKALNDLQEQSEVELQKPKQKKRYLEAMKKASEAKKAQYKQKYAAAEKHKSDVVDAFTEDISKALTERNSHEKKLEARKAKVRDLKKKFEDAKAKSTKEPPHSDLSGMIQEQADLKARIRELGARGDDIKDQTNALQTKGRGITTQIEHAEQRLENIKSVSGQREMFLRNQNQEAANVWSWYKQNGHLFEKEICPPPILCTFLKPGSDPRLADIIESTMPDRAAFICQTANDSRLFTAHVYGSRELGIEGMKCSNITIRDFSNTPYPTLQDWPAPAWSQDQLKSMGFDGYLLDFIDAPDPVKNVFCHGSRYHMLPVALKDDQSLIDRATEAGLMRWCTGTTIVSIVSRYGVSSTNVDGLRRSQWLRSQGVDLNAKAEMERNLGELNSNKQQLLEDLRAKKGEHDAVRRELASLNAEVEAIGKKKAQAQEARRAYDRAMANIPNLERQLQDEVDKGPQIKERLEQIKGQILGATSSRLQATIAYVGLLQEAFALENEWALLQLREKEAASDLDIIQRANQDLLDQIHNMKEEAEQIHRRWQTAKKVARDTYTAIHEQVASLDEEDRRRINGPDFPKSVEDLEAALDRLATQLELLAEGNPHALRQFEDRKRKIDALHAKLADLTRHVDEVTNGPEGMHAVRARWEPQVDALIDKVSRAFTYSFTKINCAGEVKIDKHPDFARWAVQIWVKFREHERMQLLDSNRQSGGERAVATVFYLMGMQSLAKSPFRVVDEINQGMDPRNERVVHHRLVNVACQEHTSQYFLITPKLLSDLLYHPRMKIHCIYSGDWVQDTLVLDYNRFFSAARKRTVDGAPANAYANGANGYAATPSSTEDDGIVADSE